MKYFRIFWIGVFILIIPILYAFYHINSLNYGKYRQIQDVIVRHPEKLPTSEAAKLSSFGFTNLMADMYWLQTIQYIGGNVIGGEYKKYLHAMMDLITDLNPYFEHPYIIGQLLLPSSTKPHEEFDGDALIGIRQGESLGLKGVNVFCDLEKIEKIKKENDLEKIISDPIYSNPCNSYKIPYYLAYIYYYYLRENQSSSDYYKVVSAQTDAPSGAKILAAIMQGKAGEREKSLHMFLSLAKSTGGEGESCNIMIDELQKTYNFISTQGLPLTGKLISDVENFSQQILPTITEENEDEIFDDTKCINFLAKAVRELNLMYIEQADAKYVADHPNEVSAQRPEKLFDLGYIDFIPTDYQQYNDEGYGVIYKYNEDIGRFDYKMSY